MSRRLLLLYFAYVVITGLLVFYIMKPESARGVDIALHETEERITLIDDLAEVWHSRVDLMSRAQETLDVSYNLRKSNG